MPASRPVAVAVAVAGLLLAGCADPPDLDGHRRGIPVTHLPAIQPKAADSDEHLPGPGSDQVSTGETSAAGAEDGPAAVAAATIIDQLAAEGLYVLDLRIETVETEHDGAVVMVAVLHGTGRGYPHDSRYQLTLERINGKWQPTAVEAAS